MDSSLINRIFRRLLSHETCSKVRHATSIPPRHQLVAHTSYRTFLGVTKPVKGRYSNKEREKAIWRQRVELEQDDKREEFKESPLVTADQLRGNKKRPRRVKMLLRDFIEGQAPIQSSNNYVPLSDSSQTAYTTQTTDTSQNKRLSSPPKSHLTFPISATNLNSSKSLVGVTPNSKMNWMKRNTMRADSFGIHPRSSSNLSTAKQWQDTWSQTISFRCTHTTICLSMK